MKVDLARASLREIARELRSRKMTCPRCGGWGRVDRGNSSTSLDLSERVCPRCFGCGLVENAALTRIAAELERIQSPLDADENTFTNAAIH
jgi:ribosomal protein S27AE